MNFEVNSKEAREFANNWINSQISSLKTYGVQGLKWRIISMQEIKDGNKTLAYNFSLYPNGHILVSAYKFLPPVKLYSYSSPLENSNLVPLIKTIFSKTVKKMKTFSKDKRIKIAKINMDSWKKFNNRIVKGVPLTATIKRPLLQTKWNQDNPYNKYSPVINGSRSYAGCVATSFSQIMKYWNYPLKGVGSHSYKTKTHHVNVSTSFAHDYYWDRMPNCIDAGSPSSQIDAVAKLIFDVGVAVEMDFKPTGSGAWPSMMVKKMPRHFRYSTNIKYDEYENYNNIHTWFTVIKAEMDKEQPVNLAIYSDDRGHSVVVDGYKIDGNDEYFHINMGWSGHYDGYYKPDSIIGFNKIEWESAITNIYPSELPNAPKPPVNIVAQRTSKNFLLYSLYYDIITWQANPTGDNKIKEYRVYEKTFDDNGDYTERIIATVAVGKMKYVMIPKGVKKDKIGYTVTAVGNNGVESRKPYYKIIQ
jgi:hypothetical protein